MDKIARYRQYLREILEDYATHRPDNAEVKNQIIADDANGHYYLMRIGWKRDKRVHACLFHVDIIGDKLWIQDDWTEYSIAQELQDKGVPKSDIVLASHAQEIRATLDFAMA